VIARVCLDMLRSRKSRSEDALDEQPEPVAREKSSTDPEREALLADSVGVALLVVLNRLDPAERLAFVLHDVFGMSFDEIAPIVDRSTAAARQLASRARRRVQGTTAPAQVLRPQQRDIAYKFITATRTGDLAGLLSLLDPDLVVRADEFAARPGAPREIHGAETWAKSAIEFSKTVRSGVAPALVDGNVGLIWAPRGQLRRVLRMSIADGRIAQIEIIGDPARLAEFEIAVLESAN
jgi:RNA polymerase sigma-70 factor (ECF subfamily)